MSRYTILVAELLVSFGILAALSMVAPVVHVSAQSDHTTVNMYPDYVVTPNTDSGCTALTGTVSSKIGGLDSSAPMTTGSGYIDQEDTSYNTNEGGASFCSFDYTGSSLTLSSASATLFLYTDGTASDIFPTTVSLVDLTSCTTYSQSSPCTPIATATDDLTNVPSGNSCSSANQFILTLNLASGTKLTQGHLYGLIVNTTSSNDNGYNYLDLCTGPSNSTPSVVSLSARSVVTPEFPIGSLLALAIPLLALSGFLVFGRKTARGLRV